MLAMPLERFAVCAPALNVTVASPAGSENETGRPSKAAARLAGATALPAESVVSAAVSVAVPFGPTTWDGLAVAVTTKRGAAVTPAVTDSRPAVPGPVLHPHPFSVASAESPAGTETAEPVLAVLPVKRL